MIPSPGFAFSAGQMLFEDLLGRRRVVESEEFFAELLRLGRFPCPGKDLDVGRSLFDHPLANHRLALGIFLLGEVRCARIDENKHLAIRFPEQSVGIAPRLD